MLLLKPHTSPSGESKFIGKGSFFADVFGSKQVLMDGSQAHESRKSPPKNPWFSISNPSNKLYFKSSELLLRSEGGAPDHHPRHGVVKHRFPFGLLKFSQPSRRSHGDTYPAGGELVASIVENRACISQNEKSKSISNSTTS